MKRPSLSACAALLLDERLPVGRAPAAERRHVRENTLAFTPGLQYLVRPNVKLGFEYQIRQERGEDRAIAQLHLSF